ncbi:hypothetical protein CgunFtcFv8_027481 [Champsocephalus gunnari]|uniref:Uncharacterized protein n=1 Tax=Champsocephalus gunnari TaxID=52237 RepID=A0AAN8E4A2_CHAGU|nr:hypothetical protein CgunFtcFv8_027481 [Champsocephalus gunnari]
MIFIVNAETKRCHGASSTRREGEASLAFPRLIWDPPGNLLSSCRATILLSTPDVSQSVLPLLASVSGGLPRAPRGPGLCRAALTWILKAARQQQARDERHVERLNVSFRSREGHDNDLDCSADRYTHIINYKDAPYSSRGRRQRHVELES